MRPVIQRHIECNNMKIKVMDNTARGTKVIVAIISVKHIMMNINKSYVEVTVFTFKNLVYNTSSENSVVLIKHGVENIPTEASLS